MAPPVGRAMLAPLAAPARKALRPSQVASATLALAAPTAAPALVRRPPPKKKQALMCVRPLSRLANALSKRPLRSRHRRKMIQRVLRASSRPSRAAQHASVRRRLAHTKRTRVRAHDSPCGCCVLCSIFCRDPSLPVRLRPESVRHVQHHRLPNQLRGRLPRFGHNRTHLLLPYVGLAVGVQESRGVELGCQRTQWSRPPPRPPGERTSFEKLELNDRDA